MSKLRTHYAVRIFRSVLHLGDTVWQPLCNYIHTSNIRMTTFLEEVNCLACRNQLIRNSKRLGINRQVNRIRREGKWHEKKR